MNPRRFLLIVFFACSFLAFYGGHASNAQLWISQESPPMSKDGPFHPGGEYKPKVTPSGETRLSPVADHNAYPAVPLVKIDILPAAITISGAHYNQRLIVEGTFTDGHQEDLTAQATFASSNPNVARISNDFAVAQGDGRAAISATLRGHRASIPVSV